MNILVNGIGNIGTTLLAVLKEARDDLGISRILALKNRPMPWHKEDLSYLASTGVIICTRNPNDGFANIDDELATLDYVFDCTSNGGALANKNWYTEFPNLKGASAQGSEKNFGISFMTGVNNDVVRNEKFVHVVSCNTHALASLLKTFSRDDFSNIESADFVIVRRSEDLGNHERLVTANVVARHLDLIRGTHHSIDVLDLLKTVNKSFRITSSDITTPSQLMHGVRFNVALKERLADAALAQALAGNPLVATSTKFDSNVIFERGRRLGLQGRIFSHAIVIANNILQVENSLLGWAFIPQEGNTILSTLHAFLLQTNMPQEEAIMQKLRMRLLRKSW